MKFKEFACKYLYENLLDNVTLYVDGYLIEKSIRLYDACIDVDYSTYYVDGARISSESVLEINLRCKDEF